MFNNKYGDKLPKEYEANAEQIEMLKVPMKKRTKLLVFGCSVVALLVVIGVAYFILREEWITTETPNFSISYPASFQPWSYTNPYHPDWEIYDFHRPGRYARFTSFRIGPAHYFGGREWILSEAINSRRFHFDDGKSGLMLELDNFGIARKVYFINHDIVMQVFDTDDNGDLIERIARTLTFDHAQHHIQNVVNGYLDEREFPGLQDITIGEAFETFFDNTEWSFNQFRFGDQDLLANQVFFHGDMMYDGELIRVEVFFIPPAQYFNTHVTLVHIHSNRFHLSGATRNLEFMNDVFVEVRGDVNQVIDPELVGKWQLDYFTSHFGDGSTDGLYEWFEGGEFLEFFANGRGRDILYDNELRFTWTGSPNPPWTNILTKVYTANDGSAVEVVYAYIIEGNRLYFVSDGPDYIAFRRMSPDTDIPPTAPHQPQVVEQWIDLGIVQIPPTWDASIGPDDTWYINAEGVNGTFHMTAFWLFDGDIDYFWANSDASFGFGFDDGGGGHEFQFSDMNIWVNEDMVGLSLWHGGDQSIINLNWEVINDVIRSLTSSR